MNYRAANVACALITAGFRCFQRFRQSIETGFHIPARMDSHHPPLFALRRLQIAKGLRLLQHGKRAGLARYGQVLRIRRSDLEEQPAVRPSLVKLAGGVREPGAETQGRRTRLLRYGFAAPKKISFLLFDARQQFLVIVRKGFDAVVFKLLGHRTQIDANLRQR